MNYDDWKATDPRDTDRDYDLEGEGEEDRFDVEEDYSNED